jgi:hypothetical protein
MDRKKLASLLIINILIFGSFAMIVSMYAISINVATTAPIVTHPMANPSSSLNDSYTVMTSTYEGIPYDLYYPRNFSGSLVILAGGILGEKHYLVGWEEILAEHGYASLGFSTKPEDLQHVAQYDEDCRRNLETLLPFVFNASLFPIVINRNSVSLVGMSGGGATVLSMNDPRIKATVAVCPYYVSDYPVHNISPVLIITGATDTIAPHNTHGLAYYNELIPDKMIIEQAGEGHDINADGWRYLISWLNIFSQNNTSAYSTLANAKSDPGILNCMSDCPVFS